MWANLPHKQKAASPNRCSLLHTSPKTPDTVLSGIIISDKNLYALPAYADIPASIQTAAEWDTELDTILEIKDVLDNYENGTVTLPQVVTLYNKVVAETVLAEKILVKALDDRGITLA